MHPCKGTKHLGGLREYKSDNHIKSEIINGDLPSNAFSKMTTLRRFGDENRIKHRKICFIDIFLAIVKHRLSTVSCQQRD